MYFMLNFVLALVSKPEGWHFAVNAYEDNDE